MPSDTNNYFPFFSKDSESKGTISFAEKDLFGKSDIFDIPFFSKDRSSASTSPTKHPFIKFDNGENILRLLSEITDGWVRWNDYNKPIHSKSILKQDVDPQASARPFLAMVAYNVTKKHIGILEITQPSLIKGLKQITETKGLENPSDYDLIVSKSGSGMETRYKIRPVAPKPLSPEIKAMFMANPCNLEALFTGDNPWKVDGVPKAQLAQGLF